MIVFGLLFIVGAVLTLGTLLVRQALIVIAVVVAPLALAGGTARITSGWVQAVGPGHPRPGPVEAGDRRRVRRRRRHGRRRARHRGPAVRADPAAPGLSGAVGVLQVPRLRRHPHRLRMAPRHQRRPPSPMVNQGRYTAQSLMRTVAPVVGGAAGRRCRGRRSAALPAVQRVAGPGWADGWRLARAVHDASRRRQRWGGASLAVRRRRAGHHPVRRRTGRRSQPPPAPAPPSPVPSPAGRTS